MMSIRPYYLLPLLCFLLACSPQKPKPEPRFEPLPASHTGIAFVNAIDDSVETSLYETVYLYNGGGVATGDINNDGLADIFFTGNQVADKLYLNLGNFQFEDISQQAGILDPEGWTTGVTMADVNGDQLLDIYVCRGGSQNTPSRKNLLYINQGNKTFKESAEQYGLASNATTTHASFFDYDRDGDLDVYLVNHPGDFDLVMDFQYYYFNPEVDTLNMNRLYENQGDKFVDVTEQAKLGYEKGFGLSISVADFNLDGWPDIFVANDFLSPDYLFINKQDGTFEESREQYFDYISTFSMGSDVADINQDGIPDLCVVDMEPATHFRRKHNDITFPLDFYSMQHHFLNARQYSRNMLQLGNPDGSYSEIGEFADIAKTDWSWTPLFGDYDNDGQVDLLITNGLKKELNDKDYMGRVFNNSKVSLLKDQPNAQELVRGIPDAYQTNVFLKNIGNAQFERANATWGLDYPLNSNGAAYADFDNDGHLDIVLNNIDSTACILRNRGDSTQAYHYLRVQLHADRGNTKGIGGKVLLYYKGQYQYQEIRNARGFQSHSEPIAHFGLGNYTQLDSLRVIWPNGRTQLISQPSIDQLLILYEKDATLPYTPPQPPTPPQYQALTSPQLPNFTHRERPFNDFKRDKTLPHMLSREGPCIAVADVNADQREDLFVGGAAGQPSALYLQTPTGAFKASNTQLWDADSIGEALDAVFFDANGDGSLDLYVAVGSNEYTPESPELQDLLYLNDGKGTFQKATTALPPMLTSSSCARPLDYDQDGDQDIFVGGRLFEANYGNSPRSYLLENQGGKFVDKTPESLQYIGMVTDAHWTQLTPNAPYSLMIVGEWMPITIFTYENNQWMNQTQALGLAQTNGWWNTLYEIDWDQDGDLDYFVGNMGHNSLLKASIEQPIILYTSDFDQSGSSDPILFHYIQGEFAPIMGRDLFCRQMPNYLNTFLTHESFAKARIDDIFTKEQLANAQTTSVYTFANSYIENQGNGKLTVRPLPPYLQTAPIWAISPLPESSSLLLAGNSFSNAYDQGYLCASRGYVIEYTPENPFHLIPYTQTGISLKGDVKAIASLQRKEDPILIVGMNNQKLQFYRTTLSPQ